MQTIQQSTSADPLTFFMVDSTDGKTGKTGLSPSVTLSKNGGSFAAPAGVVSEIANGWYKVAPNATDIDTLGILLLHATASGADPVDTKFQIVASNPRANDAGTAATQATTAANQTTEAAIAAAVLATPANKLETDDSGHVTTSNPGVSRNVTIR
jgi:hypothetical protein